MGLGGNLILSGSILRIKIKIVNEDRLGVEHWIVITKIIGAGALMFHGRMNDQTCGCQE
jgi:hypothetical protein